MLISRRQWLAGTCCGLMAPLAAPAGAAPEPLLARLAAPDIDPAPYLVSEKLDGVRALWDGGRLRFRSGAEIVAPRWFTAALPTPALDGELWLGRGRFDDLSAAVRRSQPIDAEWRALRYMLFEAPGQPGHFGQRHALLRRWVEAARHPQLRVVEQWRLPDRAALRARLAEVLAAGGEGLMLHRSDAPYVGGRSDALLKLKPWHDTEARVVGHVAGRGRHAGRLGALELETPQGLRFRLGTGDAQRLDPPPIGSTVSYRYRELTPTGRPRFASFMRVREE
jgi:DNA ligase-1